MTEPSAEFTTGRYHERFKSISRDRLTHLYRRSMELVEAQGWDNPLNKQEAPYVLQCGTGSADTTSTFVDFVLSTNKDAKISVLDLSDKPLNSSKVKITEEKGAQVADRIDFIKANALVTGLSNASVDMIETDFFLQFFPSEDKKKLIAEWSRILRPGGIITTRDWVQGEGRVGAADKVFDIGRRTWIRRRLGPKAYKTSVKELKKLFSDAHLDANIVSARIPHTRLHAPLMKFIVARKPLHPEETVAK